MPKSFNQKLKILYLMRVFLERADEKHPITVPELILYLQDYGISAERKTIYDDIEALKVYGMDIKNRREKPSGFYLASRNFELAELKLLVDAVQSSRFITHRKSRQLIRKLEGLASVHEARLLQRQVFVESRVKTVNESIYTNIDEIHSAISNDRQISFQYFEWTITKEMRLKRNGERYVISPWGMVWKDENYYLIALDEKSNIVKHYRVDKMLDIRIIDQRRNGEELFKNFDIAKFASRTFGMFGGKEEVLRLEFENHLVGVVIDRFGQEIMMHKKDDSHFSVLVHVNVSSQFYGWLAGLGPGVVITSPENIRREYTSFLKRALEGYEKKETP